MKKYITIITLLLTAIVFDACKVTKDVSVKPDLPVAYRNAGSTDSNSIAAMPWSAFFKDPTLQQLIGNAIAKNYDMQLALKNIEAAQLVLQQSKLGNIPQAYLQVTAGSTRYSDNSLTGLEANQYLSVPHIEDYNANIGLSWEADIWGKIRSRKDKALAAYLQTNEARKAIQTNIVLNVSQGFYNLLMLDAQLAITKKNILLDDSILRIIRFQFDAGQVSYLGVQQAEVQKLAAAQLIPQFELEIALQENAISVLSGELPDSVHRTVTMDNIAVPDSLSGGVPAQMVSYRPDVKSSELALQIANANVGIARAEMYPGLNISAEFGLNSFKANDWFNIPASLFGLVAGSVVQPLFEQKQYKTQYRLAEIEREKAVLHFRESVLNAVGEVSDALITMQKLKEEQTIATDRADTLQQTIVNANMLFKNGVATYLEVITAQGNALQSELEQVSIKRAQLNAAVELYSALGGGWQ
jgi:outer membrane protein, multidrug efflux system